jgi:histidine ammonia-lyase
MVYHGGNFLGFPNNNDNQDIVSMCNAALLTNKVIHNGFDVLSVQLLVLMQAIDHL